MNVVIFRLVLSIWIRSWTAQGNVFLGLDIFLEEFMMISSPPNLRLWIEVNCDSDHAIDLVIVLKSIEIWFYTYYWMKLFCWW